MAPITLVPPVSSIETDLNTDAFVEENLSDNPFALSAVNSLQMPELSEADIIREVLKLQMDRIDLLDPTQRDYLVIRFGLNGEEPHTEKEAALKSGLPYAQAQELEGTALRTLYRP